MSWFYVKNEEPKEGEEPVDMINLPNKFAIGPLPEKNNGWNYNPEECEDSDETVQEIELVHQALPDLIVEGLTADDLLRVWTERRISPLQKHAVKICYMDDRMDPRRMSTFVLSKESVYRRVKAIA